VTADLRRGGIGQPRTYTEVAQNSFTTPTGRPVATDVVASTPVPDPPARLIRSADDNRHHGKAEKVSTKGHKASAKASHHHGKSKRKKA
jgi:hypothetical protein